jgi:hypothetical protein
MRPREDRRRVVINSRLRCGVHWLDARIVNLSSRGLGLTAASPPVAGSYVEIRRGAHLIIARVMWVSGLRFGVKTQDRVPVDALVSHRDSPPVPPAQDGSSPAIERRRVARSPADRQERSRAVGRAIEFACIAAFGASVALVGFGAARQALQQPLDAVHEALSN